eukprot:TRINITY_DN67923_c0_g1_i1.p1 TRINITY_DN67923_c0_g1~~TRINITY_DN67923_c0_g1_i1.p1  ORF type:complete len:158 (+),score=13.05 TRINITY_DN67923_c0_g1_i1:16-489(+)
MERLKQRVMEHHSCFTAFTCHGAAAMASPTRCCMVKYRRGNTSRHIHIMAVKVSRKVVRECNVPSSYYAAGLKFPHDAGGASVRNVLETIASHILIAHLLQRLLQLSVRIEFVMVRALRGSSMPRVQCEKAPTPCRIADRISEPVPVASRHILHDLA